MKKLPHKNGKPPADRQKVRQGSNRQNRRASRLSKNLSILYEDEAVVVVDKPAGLLAVPVEGLEHPSALSLISEQLKRSRQRAFVVHRIDRFTSGILLFAKTERDREDLIRQFLAHSPIRQYSALVRGHLSEKQGALVHYFRREGMFQKLTTMSDSQGTRAELHYVVERRLRAASLVGVTLVTGLQNQIRVQFSATGHPVIGDRKYHPAEALERRISRVALHAGHLQFIHPRTGAGVSIVCELPPDIRSLLQALAPLRNRTA